jgi:hypothetical protein
MKQKYTKFDNYVIEQIKKSFKFLEDEYYCSIDKIEKDSWAMSVFYKNATTAVRICLDQSGAGLYVDLIRLINNKFPEEPIYYRKNTKMDSFIFTGILKLRAPSLTIDEPNLDDLVFNPGREKVISSVLRQHAGALKKYAQDVLSGDFKIFDKLNSLRKQPEKEGGRL